MLITKISLKSPEEIKEFNRIICRYDIECDLSSGRYVIDAKSILGIFSIPIHNDIKLFIHANKSDCRDMIEEIQKYVTEPITQI